MPVGVLRRDRAGLVSGESEELGPIFAAQHAALGQRRMDEHYNHHAAVQFNMLILTTTIASVPAAGYSDVALACMKQDAKDLRVAASAYAEWVEQLADDWRAQRSEHGA